MVVDQIFKTVDFIIKINCQALDIVLGRATELPIPITSLTILELSFKRRDIRHSRVHPRYVSIVRCSRSLRLKLAVKENCRYTTLDRLIPSLIESENTCG